MAGFLAGLFFLNTLIFTLFYFLFIVLQLLGIITKSIKRTFLTAYIFFLCHWFMDFIELLKLQIVLSYEGENCENDSLSLWNKLGEHWREGGRLLGETSAVAPWQNLIKQWRVILTPSHQSCHSSAGKVQWRALQFAEIHLCLHLYKSLLNFGFID